MFIFIPTETLYIGPSGATTVPNTKLIQTKISLNFSWIYIMWEREFATNAIDTAPGKHSNSEPKCGIDLKIPKSDYKN